LIKERWALGSLRHSALSVGVMGLINTRPWIGLMTSHTRIACLLFSSFP
jgi:hypothetical protein